MSDSAFVTIPRIWVKGTRSTAPPQTDPSDPYSFPDDPLIPDGNAGGTDNPTDDAGNTTPPGPVPIDYPTAVLSTFPDAYWPMNESAGTTIADVAYEAHGPWVPGTVTHDGVWANYHHPFDADGTFTLGEPALVTGETGYSSVKVACADPTTTGTASYEARLPMSLRASAWSTQVLVKLPAGGFHTPTTLTVFRSTDDSGNEAFSLRLTGDGHLSIGGDGIARVTIGTLSLNVPHQLTLTRYPNGTLTVFLDGAALAGVAGFTPSAENDKFAVGFIRPQSADHAYWWVQHAVYWARVLTTDEIANMWAGVGGGAVGPPPTNTLPPTLSADHYPARPGDKVSYDTGEWSGPLPIEFAVSLERSRDGAVWQPVAGDIADFRVTPADALGWLRVLVQALNPYGSTSTVSDPIRVTSG